MAQVYNRLKGDNKCPLHPEQMMIMQCTDCPNALLCTDCLPLHNRHEIRGLNHNVKEKVEKIQSRIKHTESKTIPKLYQEIKSTDQKIQDFKTACANDKAKSREYGKHLKDLVDLLIDERVSQLEKHLQKNIDLILERRKRLEKLQKEMEEYLKELKTAVRMENDILVHDTEDEISKSSETQIPEWPKLVIPNVRPCKDPRFYINQTLGNILDEGQQGATEDARKLSTDAAVAYNARVTKLLNKPIILSSAPAPDEFYSIRPTSNNMAWAVAFEKNALFLIDQNGYVKETKTLETKVIDIFIAPTSEEMYGCFLDYSIRKINTKNFTTEIMFNTDSKTKCIACFNDVLIVGMMSGKLCKYTPSGKMIHTNNFSNIKRLSICRNTNKIALTCYDDGIIILNDTLKEINRCNRIPDNKNLRSYCAEFDNNGYLLVGDCVESKVHILDADNGQYISFINVDGVHHVLSVGILPNGLMLVSTFTPITVKSVKYTE